MLLEDGEARRRQNKREPVDARPSNASRRRRWRNATSWLQDRHHRARLLKYYPRRPYAPSFVKSRMLRPLLTHFLFLKKIFFVLVCIHPGTPRVPPRVLASGPKPCGGNKWSTNWKPLKALKPSIDVKFYFYYFFTWTTTRHDTRKSLWGVCNGKLLYWGQTDFFHRMGQFLFLFDQIWQPNREKLEKKETASRHRWNLKNYTKGSNVPTIHSKTVIALNPAHSLSRRRG